MIIAIDGYEANQKNRVGIGRYAYEILVRLYEEIGKSHAQETGNKKQNVTMCIVYLPDPPLPDMPKETSYWTYRVVRPKKLWTFIGLPLAITREKVRPDVIYSPTHYIPRFVTIPRVMAIMDLSFLSYPELFRSKDLHQLVHWTAYGAKHAAAIFTISEFSRNAILDRYRVARGAVTVTYPGLNIPMISHDQKRPAGELPGLTKKYGIADHYILSVGTIQPRKNYVRLIEAFSEFLKKNKQKFGVVDLVIVGKKGWLVDDILHAPEKYGVQNRVKILESVPDEDLPGLYAHALTFALPSLYEGFGLPVLEAMAYGCPIVVSNVSSLPEIAGKAGVYVHPENVDDIARGLLASVRERNLMQGRLRIKRGYEQVKKFSWAQAGRKTLEILEAVAHKKGGVV
jgi:glycosyltransferase involved in cell wall biosynthesis